MGQFFPSMDQFPVEDQIKTLGDDELLDFGEETQYLEKLIEEEFSAKVEYPVEYERIIIQELQIRSC